MSRKSENEQKFKIIIKRKRKRRKKKTEIARKSELHKISGKYTYSFNDNRI